MAARVDVNKREMFARRLNICLCLLTASPVLLPLVGGDNGPQTTPIPPLRAHEGQGVPDGDQGAPNRVYGQGLQGGGQGFQEDGQGLHGGGQRFQGDGQQVDGQHGGGQQEGVDEQWGGQRISVDPVLAADSAKIEDDEMEVFGLPGTQHEFRVEVPGAMTECFYQFLKKAAMLHLSFEVRLLINHN